METKLGWFRLAAHGLGVAGSLSGAYAAWDLSYSPHRIFSIALFSYFAAYGIAYFSAEVAGSIWSRKR